MENINFILIFFLVLLNINLDYGQEVEKVHPSRILLNGKKIDIILTFKESMENKEIENLTLQHSPSQKFTLSGRNRTEDPEDIYKLFFSFDQTKDFINPKYETGYYYIYYGSNKTANEDKILIYKNEISLIICIISVLTR